VISRTPGVRAMSEEPRQTMHDGARLFMDVTRATHRAPWNGWIETPNGRHQLPEGLRGTKIARGAVRARSANRCPASRVSAAPQLAFFWGAPAHRRTAYALHERSTDAHGHPLSRSAVLLPTDNSAVKIHGDLKVEMRRGTRWMHQAVLTMGDSVITLTPLLRFQMRGAGYSHPQYAHGRWHGSAIVDRRTARPEYP